MVRLVLLVSGSHFTWPGVWRYTTQVAYYLAWYQVVGLNGLIVNTQYALNTALNISTCYSQERMKNSTKAKEKTEYRDSNVCCYKKRLCASERVNESPKFPVSALTVKLNVCPFKVLTVLPSVWSEKFSLLCFCRIRWAYFMFWHTFREFLKSSLSYEAMHVTYKIRNYRGTWFLPDMTKCYMTYA